MLTPEGEELRVPAWAFPKLRRLGLLEKNQAQLVPAIWLYLLPDFDTLLDGVAKLLGADLSGPKWLVCRCKECQQKQAEIDHTLHPGQAGNLVDELVREVTARRGI